MTGAMSRKDLIVDEVYGGGRFGNASDDPLPALVGVDSGAGFRHLGKRPAIDTLRLVVLKSNFNEPDWPDEMDRETGVFTYFGDNRRPGKELHDTPRQGNAILRNMFLACHDRLATSHFPAILVFGSTGEYRDVRFLGLAVPGTETTDATEDLVAIWRTSDTGQRFQNYRARFSIIDVPVLPRLWIDDIKSGVVATSPHAPRAWLDWLHHRRYHVLKAPRGVTTRSKDEQLPGDADTQKILKTIFERFRDQPAAFERIALEAAKLMMPDIHSADLTRPWRDGGRDAIGLLRVGKGISSISVEFALEAKCYAKGNGVGVREISRLISRLRHRQFGILVTTSYVAKQAYAEVQEDGHPIVIISGGDLAGILREKIGIAERVADWLDAVETSEAAILPVEPF